MTAHIDMSSPPAAAIEFDFGDCAANLFRLGVRRKFTMKFTGMEIPCEFCLLIR